MAKYSSNIQKDGQDFPPKLSRRDDKGEASFRVLYYGGAAGSVPFMWESQPGTPKHKFNDDALPPLTPPPSYQLSRQPNSLQKKNSRFLHSIFPRFHHSMKINNASMSFSPSSSYSSLYSLSSTPLNMGKNMKSGSSAVHRVWFDEYENGHGRNSPTSTLCFGPRNGSSCRRSSKGYFYPIRSVKKMVSSIVGHGKGNV